MDTAAPSSGPALILSTPSCWERQACSACSGGRGAEAQEERALPPKHLADGISKQGRVLPTRPAQSRPLPPALPRGPQPTGTPGGQRGHPWTALFSCFSFGQHLSTAWPVNGAAEAGSVGTKEINVSINSAAAWPGCWLGVDPFLLGGAAQGGGTAAEDAPPGACSSLSAGASPSSPQTPSRGG